MLTKFSCCLCVCHPHPHVDQRTEFRVTSCEYYAIGQHPNAHFQISMMSYNNMADAQISQAGVLHKRLLP